MRVILEKVHLDHNEVVESLPLQGRTTKLAVQVKEKFSSSKTEKQKAEEAKKCSCLGVLKKRLLCLYAQREFAALEPAGSL